MNGFPLRRRRFQYAFAFSISILAGAIEIVLERAHAPHDSPFLAASAALVASACWVGPGPGLLSLAIIVAWLALVLTLQGLAPGITAILCLAFLAEGLLLCIGCARAATALRRAAASERWHRRLTETAAEGIQVENEEGVITWANPRMAEILSCSLRELIGRKTEEFLFPEDVPFERIRIRNRRENVREQFDRRLRRKDGSEVWVLVSARSFRSAAQGPPGTASAPDGEFHGILSMMTDITERKNAEQALRRSEERFRGLFENVPEGVYQSTPDGRILAANPALLRMLGLDKGTDLNRVDIARDLYVDPNLRRQLLDRLEREGSIQNVEYALRGFDGRVIRVLENARAVRNDDGGVLCFEGTLTDITEKRDLEEQVRRNQETQATGRMAGAVAQDFSNALTAISGYAHLVLADLRDSDPTHALDLLRAVESASEMTRQLTAFSRRRAAHSTAIDLNRLLFRVEDTMRRIAGPDVALTIHAAATPLLVQADPIHLEQIAVNLANGARRAIAGPGSMEVKTETSDYFATLSMRCTGCGENNSGHFGLSTLQAIVAQYGGTVTEEMSQGTTLVSVSIPEAR